DIGPEGGDKGGNIICSGTPEVVSKNINSFTGEFLKKELEIHTIQPETSF
ncbi:MAG: hypothetical protein JNK41_09535, partial [Saprospiraceae bacterium]|nr:hypothetical protein [Saprospiraceae bacterium]